MQQRLQSMQLLYHQKDGVYIDVYPAIMQFLQHLADDQQTAASVLKAIEATDKAVVYGWDFSDLEPVLKRLKPAKQKQARFLIDFFNRKLDLKRLKSKLP